MPDLKNPDQNDIVPGTSMETKNNFDIVHDYQSYLEMKGYKDRGIQESIRSANYFLKHLQSRNLRYNTLNFKQAEGYREYLCCLTDEYGKSKYKPATINKMMTQLKSFYNYLVHRELVLANPFQLVERMKQGVKIPMNRLSKEQMKRLLQGVDLKSQADFKFKVLLELLYSTGARVSELENLRLADIDMDSESILIRDDKERQDRRLPLTRIAVTLLKLYLQCSPKPLLADPDADFALFAQGEARTLNKWLNNRLKELCLKQKLPKITCHGIRHTIATHLLQAGANLREIQQFLGHRRIQNTEIYTSVLTEDLRKTIQKSHPREKRRSS